MRNVPYKFMYSNTWFPHPRMVVLFGEVMDPLGGGASLEEIPHWLQAFRVSSLTALPVYSLKIQSFLLLSLCLPGVAMPLP